MNADIITDTTFPHGTTQGFEQGCTTGHCPSDVSCKTVFTRFHGDYAFWKQINAGKTPMEYVAEERKQAQETADADLRAKRDARASQSTETREAARERHNANRRAQRAANLIPRESLIPRHQLRELLSQGLTDFRRTSVPEPSGECPQPCVHLSQEDAREGRTCAIHPCTCRDADLKSDDRRQVMALKAEITTLKAIITADRYALPRRTSVPEPSGEVAQVLGWIDKTLALPMYQTPALTDYDDAVVTTLKTVRKMLNGTTRPDASWRTAEPQSEPSDALNLDYLERVAKAATPGPWTDFNEDGEAYSRPPATGAFLVEYGADVEQKMRDIRYIAAVDPQTVLALIAAARQRPAPIDAIVGEGKNA
ncbi:MULTISPECIES: hypothetical protein [unclassified Microbacterium]|uniref:hypothetical protein n=1 Tax=unclassified Microbacterium TaxID=2609290 RepID=UPI000EAA2683|nr:MULTISPECIES: hypothetical protein [unclassified Microbacterium]MBT2485792.1 hypothetical protein [Microbacterium sp. ISL-108]RKN68554.1 hypothetical protein D7252_13830 [Microbacterium sp. CGR2]